MIIGISGKKQAGKDTVGKIIQYLHWKNYTINKDPALKDIIVSFEDFFKTNLKDQFYKNKKFADKLKDIVCLLIGCTKESLENEEFKNTLLSKEWWYYKDFTIHKIYTIEEYNSLEEDYKNWLSLVKPTPRTMLQLLGTECGRKIIHPDIWVNSTMVDYKPIYIENYVINQENYCVGYHWETQLPNWVITDVRFPNELKAIKENKGLVIRVNRFDDNGMPLKYIDAHESEIALDNYEDFDWVIDNKGTINDLMNEVDEFMEYYNLYE